jgi:hypothetical protein
MVLPLVVGRGVTHQHQHHLEDCLVPPRWGEVGEDKRGKVAKEGGWSTCVGVCAEGGGEARAVWVGGWRGAERSGAATRRVSQREYGSQGQDSA